MMRVSLLQPRKTEQSWAARMNCSLRKRSGSARGCFREHVQDQRTHGRGTRTCCSAVAKYPPGSYASDDEVENKAVFLNDDAIDDNAEQIAIDMARLAWETKVENVSVVDVAAQTSVCSYMVIATVFSRPQLNAVLGKMEKAVTETWKRDYTLTSGRSAWEALDMGDVLVHIMSEEARHYYNLEGLYEGGVPVELPFMSAEDRAKRDVWTTKL